MRTIVKFKNLLILLITGLPILCNSTNAQSTDHWETLFYSNSSFQYFTSAEGIPSSDWRELSFDASSWRTGNGGIGYGDNDDNTQIENCISLCLRKSFYIPDTSVITDALLHIDYDDAFVAYLNGEEIARSPGLTGAFPEYDQNSSVNHEAKIYNGGIPDTYTIKNNQLRDIMLKGDNLLAVQIHNTGISSSDLSSHVFFSVGIKDNSTFFLPTPDWFTPPISEWNSSLPIIIIDTYGKPITDEPKVDGHMKIIYQGVGIINNPDDNPGIYNGNIGIEVRGATSSNYPQKPYALETRTPDGANNNVSLLGMPPENDWVLISHYNEKTFARNLLAFHLFDQMGHYATRMKLCQVIVNEVYQGIYIFGEKIKRDDFRVDISELSPISNSGDSLTGGYIFKTEYYTNQNTWLSDYPPMDHPDHRTHFAYYYPKYYEISQQQQYYIKNFVDQFQQVLRQTDFADEYRNYIDIHSFIDYFLISELSRNIDGYKKSRYFYKDRDHLGGLLHAGPVWDFDWAWKNIPSCLFQTTDCSGWAYKVNDCQNSPSPGWMVRLLQDPKFADLVKCRYDGLRKTILSENYINEYIDSIYSTVYQAQKNHYLKWKILGVRTGAPEIEPPAATYDEEVERLRNWISLRLQWLDNNMPGNIENCHLSQEEYTSEVHTRIFPNPAHSHVYIEADESIQALEVMNSMGRIVMQRRYDGIFSIQLDVNEFPRGLLLVKITTVRGKIITNKLIVK